MISENYTNVTPTAISDHSCCYFQYQKRKRKHWRSFKFLKCSLEIYKKWTCDICVTLSWKQERFFNQFSCHWLYYIISLYSLNILVNLWFSDVFRGVRMRPGARNKLMKNCTSGKFVSKQNQTFRKQK